MTSKLALLALLFLLPITNFAQKVKSPAAIREMVETEQAFSKTAEVKSTRDAFMEFIAADGLLFRPKAVNGKKWMSEHPVPASDSHPLLAWQPTFADMSLAGDLGFTTGPWEFKNDIKDAKPAGYGHFVTLWKKQADGSWKFVLDLGISHPESGGPLDIWKVEDSRHNTRSRPIDTAKATAALIQRDRTYAESVLKQGLSQTFFVYAAPEIRLYVPDKLPYIGRSLALPALTTIKGVVAYQPVAGDVSRSGDLGYTHGTYEKTNADAPEKVVESGSYLRIWKRQSGVWRIVLDVTNPLP